MTLNNSKQETGLCSKSNNFFSFSTSDSCNIQEVNPTHSIYQLKLISLILLLTIGSFTLTAQFTVDGAIRVNDASYFGISVKNQDIQNNTSIILHEGLNNWEMLSNGAIVLKDNHEYGLTVLDQNISNGASIILHKGYNLWEVLSSGAIVLKDNHNFGLTVQSQDMNENTSIILHEGYNTWSDLKTEDKPEFRKVAFLFHALHCISKTDGFFGGKDEVNIKIIADGKDVTDSHLTDMPYSLGNGQLTKWKKGIYEQIQFNETLSIVFTEIDDDANDALGKIDVTRSDVQRNHYEDSIGASGSGTIVRYRTTNLDGAGDYEILYHVLYADDLSAIMVP